MAGPKVGFILVGTEDWAAIFYDTKCFFLVFTIIRHNKKKLYTIKIETIGTRKKKH